MSPRSFLQATMLSETPDDSNCGTRVLSPGEPTLSPPAGQLAFEVALRQLRLLADGAPAGFVAALVDGQGRLRGTTVLPVGKAVTIGRHEACQLQLRSEIAPLRALTALVVPGDAGEPILRLWDLATGQPFCTEDGALARAVVADGPTFVTLGGCGVWFVPTAALVGGPSAPGAAYDALPRRAFLEHEPPVLRPDARASAPREDVEATGLREPGRSVTHVSRVAPAVQLTEDEPLGPAWGELHVQVDDAYACRRVSAEQLGRGLLVGRYPRCALRLLDGDSMISRVHALLVRVGAVVWVIDAGSTSGLALGGDPIVAAPVGHGARVALTERASLTWRRWTGGEA